MIADKKIFKPIKTLGFIFMFSGFFILFLLITQWNEMLFSVGGRIFVAILSFWHLLTGFGILLRRPWGFYLLKSILSVLYIGWPFGTMFSKWMFAYIKDNEIKAFFYNEVLEV